MATPARVLYATQNATVFPSTTIITGSDGKYSGCYSLALNSVSLDVSNPIENVLTFGTLGAAARLQKEPSKTKITLKSYLTTGKASVNASEFDYNAITTLTGNALGGTYSAIVVEPYGFTGYGILTNLALDASTNNFVTLDLSFEGVGTPTFPASVSSTIGNSAYNGSTPLVTGITPITSNLVAAGITSTDGLFTGAPGSFISAGTGAASYTGFCVSSAKFSLDIPSDMITCLGAQITGSQLAVASGNVMVGKPPFKATLTVEGTAATACDSVDFGSILVKLPQPRLMSTAINQAVGNVGQTYSYTIEDVSANFSKSTLIGVNEPDLIGD